MSCLNIYTNDDTFISKNDHCQNFYCCPCLLTGKGLRDYSSNDTTIILIRFDLESLCGCNAISRAELKLFLNPELSCDCGCDSCIPIEIYKVLNCYDPCRVTWDFHPAMCKTCCGRTIRSTDGNCIVNLDVTCLVREWVSKRCPNFGLAVVVNSCKKTLSFRSSRTCTGPYLTIESCECPQSCGHFNGSCCSPSNCGFPCHCSQQACPVCQTPGCSTCSQSCQNSIALPY